MTFRRQDQDRIEVPRRVELLLGLEDLLPLQSLPDLALSGLEIADGVLGIDGVDVQAEAVLRFWVPLVRSQERMM